MEAPKHPTRWSLLELISRLRGCQRDSSNQMRRTGIGNSTRPIQVVRPCRGGRDKIIVLGRRSCHARRDLSLADPPGLLERSM